MNVDELFLLSVWVEEELLNPNIQGLYQNLLNKLQHNAQHPQKQPFENELRTIINALNKISLESLTYQQKEILEQEDVTQYLGSNGVKFIEETLYKNNLDLATAANKMSQAVGKLGETIERFEIVNRCLQDFISEEISFHDDKYLVRVTFTREVSIENFSDLKRTSDEWYEIIRGIALASDESPEDIEIIGTSRGSIIIDLAAAYFTVWLLSTIIKEGLVLTERILNIKKMSQEIKLNQYSIRAAEELNKQAEKEKEEAKNSTLNILIEKLEIKIDGEKREALSRSVDRLFNFLEKGGEIDFLPPQEAEDEEGEEELSEEDIKKNEEIKFLKSEFEEIRKLESHISLLEFDQKDED